ncbi:MAG: hypothetical protein NC131_01010 [Roseburia sp.]|nr:hypothetical protein [Roseburia sp.]
MSYYDYDYKAEPNYPEVEEIIENASSEFSKFLHDTFASEYKAIETARQNNAIKEKALNERSNSLDKRERNLQEREAELTKSEEEQYNKLKTKWFTELGLAFDIGDTVYYCREITKRVTCPTCNGNKKVKAKIESADNSVSELDICCPTCNGCGTVSGKREYEIVEATVEQIDADIKKYSKGSINIKYKSDWNYELITCVWVRDKKGNDSHQIKGCDLYKTKEEAEHRMLELLAKD